MVNLDRSLLVLKQCFIVVWIFAILAHLEGNKGDENVYDAQRKSDRVKTNAIEPHVSFLLGVLEINISVDIASRITFLLVALLFSWTNEQEVEAQGGVNEDPKVEVDHGDSHINVEITTRHKSKYDQKDHSLDLKHPKRIAFKVCFAHRIEMVIAITAAPKQLEEAVFDPGNHVGF